MATHVHITFHIPAMMTQAEENSLTNTVRTFRTNSLPQGTTVELQYARDISDRSGDA